RLDHDPRPARRHRPRLRDADGRHERDHGARPADGVSAGLAVGAYDYRHTRAADRLDGRRRAALRAGAGRGRAVGEILIPIQEHFMRLTALAAAFVLGGLVSQSFAAYAA